MCIRDRFFSKPKAKYNILNDIDSEVFNFFQVISLRKQEFDHPFIIEQAKEYEKQKNGNISNKL